MALAILASVQAQLLVFSSIPLPIADPTLRWCVQIGLSIPTFLLTLAMVSEWRTQVPKDLQLYEDEDSMFPLTH